MSKLKRQLDLLPGVRAKWVAIACFWWSGIISSNTGITFLFLVKGSDENEPHRPWVVQGILIAISIILLVIGVLALDRYKRAEEDVS